MKLRLHLLVLLICSIELVSVLPFTGYGANRIWSTHQPEGGKIRALAIDPRHPSTLYAGTWAGGVFKSIDGGQTWGGIEQLKKTLEVNSLAIDPKDSNKLYAGGVGEIYVSVDQGATWSTTQSNSNPVEALAIDPQNSNTIFAATNGEGVLRSTDSGATWIRVNSGLSGQNAHYVWTIAVSPRDSNVVLAGTEGGLFLSRNGGESWSMATGLTRAIAFDPTNPSTIYAAGDGFFKSVDGGINWTQSWPGLPGTYLLSLALDPVHPNTVYVGGYVGVFKSTDGSVSWTEVNTGLPRVSIRALVIDPENSNIVYAGTNGGGVFKSSNAGMNWSPAVAGMTPSGVSSIVVSPQDPKTLYASTGSTVKCGSELWGAGGSGVFKSTDGGSSWSAINSGLQGSAVSIVAINPHNSNTIYAGTRDNNQTSGVYKSNDGGLSWRAAKSGLPYHGVNALAVDPKDSNTLYAGTYGSGVFKSTNGGDSWAEINSGITDLVILVLLIDAQSSNLLYTGTAAGGVFKSINGGKSWIQISPYITSVTGLAFDPNNPSTIYAAAWSQGVFKSADRGEIWTNLGLMGEDISAVSIDPENSTTIFAGSYRLGLFKSTDGGASWNLVDAGGATAKIISLAVNPQTPCGLYAGTDNDGIFVGQLTVPKAATLRSPSKNIDTNLPAYIWNAVPLATHYCLWVNDSGTKSGKIKTWYTAKEAGCESGILLCSVKPSTALGPGSAQWWIQTWNDSGYGPWSDGMSFSVVGALPAKGTPRK